MSMIATTSKFAIDNAAESGLVAVFPLSNQLQLDIDDQESFDVFEDILIVLQQRYETLKIEITPSKSGGKKRHITLTLRGERFGKTERILLQACLGSDRKRELLSYFRVLDCDERPTLFLERVAA